jgi:hypothetical protein
MTTILCTHCRAIVRQASAEDVESIGAVFCSAACEAADAARPAAAPDIRVLVAIVHNQPTIAREVAQNFIALGWGNRVARAKDAHGIAAIDLAWFTKHPRVDDLRNVALEQALRDGFSHVLFLDADMLHPDDLFERMLGHVHRDCVVSGFYTQRQYPFAPIALRDRQLHASGAYSSYKHDDHYRDVDADGLRDEDVVGMGCCLIPLSIVRSIGPRPWFEYKPNDEGWHLVSEDVPFCEKVIAAGFRVCLDPSISCGHMYSEFATEAHWTRAREVMAHTQQAISEALTLGVTADESSQPAAVGD